MSDKIPGDAYPLIEKMRTVFEEVISMLKDDEARLRQAYNELQQERDEMRSELLFWRAEAHKWNAERRYYEHQRTQGNGVAASTSPSPPPPAPPARDRLSEALREAPVGSLPAAAPLREHSLTSHDPPPREEGRPMINYNYYNTQRGEQVSDAPIETKETPLPDTKYPLKRESTARYEDGNGRKGQVAVRKDSPNAKNGASISEVNCTLGDLVNSSTNTDHSRQTFPNCFWIYVWPAFGNSAPLYIEPAKVFVYGHYRYMEDVTEKAAKALNCQPAPSCLHEPDGTPVRSLRLLIPNQHYIIFPSGAYYRQEAVPQRLLNALVRNAQQVLDDSPY